MNRGICAACRRKIDATARICPFCGANAVNGQRVDTQAILDEVFRPRRLTASETLIEYARQRQGIVIAVAAIIVFLVLAALHQLVTIRNAATVSNDPPVPLTEIADLSNRPDQTKTLPMPDLSFQYEGRAEALRTYIVEPGAAAPPQPAAAPGTPPQHAARRPARPPR